MTYIEKIHKDVIGTLCEVSRVKLDIKLQVRKYDSNGFYRKGSYILNFELNYGIVKVEKDIIFKVEDFGRIRITFGVFERVLSCESALRTIGNISSKKKFYLGGIKYDDGELGIDGNVTIKLKRKDQAEYVENKLQELATELKRIIN